MGGALCVSAGSANIAGRQKPVRDSLHFVDSGSGQQHGMYCLPWPYALREAKRLKPSNIEIWKLYLSGIRCLAGFSGNDGCSRTSF